MGAGAPPWSPHLPASPHAGCVPASRPPRCHLWAFPISKYSFCSGGPQTFIKLHKALAWLLGKSLLRWRNYLSFQSFSLFQYRNNLFLLAVSTSYINLNVFAIFPFSYIFPSLKPHIISPDYLCPSLS